MANAAQGAGLKMITQAGSILHKNLAFDQG